MTESRFNDLALSNVHTNKHIDIDLDVNEFARKKKENAFRVHLEVNRIIDINKF